MIEQLPAGFDGGPSAFEVAFRAALEELLARRVWIITGEPHARPGALLEEPDGLGEFRELLEAGAGHLAAVQVAVAEEARAAAVKVRALAAFARCRPTEVLDRPAEQVGAAAAASRAARPAALTEVSEWAVDEVAACLGLSARAAGALLADAVTLVERLPATVAALEAGTIGFAQARMLAGVLAPLKEADRAEVEAGLLAGAAGTTPAALKAAAVRAVLRADASAAVARAARAVREREVRLFTDPDGMSTLTAPFPAPVGAACYSALEGYAEACVTPGDTRTKAQRMVDCLAELILQPGLHPPVQVQLTVAATAGTLTGGDEPGEVDGHPVPAGMVRELAHTLGLLPRPTLSQPEDTTPAVPGEPTQPGEPAEPVEPGEPGEPAERIVPAPPRAPEQAGSDLAALLGLSAGAGGVLTAPPTIAIVEEISGQLLALTDATELRRTATCSRRACRTGTRPCTHPPTGGGLGPPGPSNGYRPGNRLDRFVRARDRRCRFPGCRARAIVCDLDHTIPWPHGATSADNLCSLCRHHHRLRHQAPGWHLSRLPDGGLRWTLPGGQTRTTYPPRYRTDDLDPPPTAPEPPAAAPAVPPLTPGTVDDDPPPF